MTTANKSWAVTLGSFGMLFGTILAESFGLQISSEAIAAAQNIAIASAGAGAAVSVAKRVPEMRKRLTQEPVQEPVQKQSATQPYRAYELNTIQHNNKETLLTGQDLYITIHAPHDIAFATVKRQGTILYKASGHGTICVKMLSATPGKYELCLIMQQGNQMMRPGITMFYVTA